MSTPVWLDVDFSADKGDLPDAVMSFALHRLGIFRMIATTVCTSAAKAPGALAATRKWCGLSSIPLGTWKGAALDPFDGAWGDWKINIYDTYDRDGVGLASTVEDGVTTARRALAAEDDGSVVMIAGGPLNMIAAVMQSAADGLSPLTGLELIAAKVKAFWPCIGIFPSGSEWNANITTLAASSANYVAANWPSSVPLYWVGTETGTTPLIGGVSLSSKANGDLVKFGMGQYPTTPTNYVREAWTQMAIFAAWTQNHGFDKIRGTASFHATTGANTFSESDTGKQFYLVKTGSDTDFQNWINGLVSADFTADPFEVDYGAAPKIVTI